MDEHARYGGVVPEIAARAHVHAVRPVIRRALDEAGLTLSDVGAVAITTGPGLSGALQVGLARAKGLAYALGVPLYGGTSSPVMSPPTPWSTARCPTPAWC